VKLAVSPVIEVLGESAVQALAPGDGRSKRPTKDVAVIKDRWCSWRSENLTVCRAPSGDTLQSIPTQPVVVRAAAD